MYTVHLTVYTVHLAVYIVHLTVFTVHFQVYTVNPTVHSAGSGFNQVARCCLGWGCELQGFAVLFAPN